MPKQPRWPVGNDRVRPPLWALGKQLTPLVLFPRLLCVVLYSVAFDSLRPVDCSPPGSAVCGIFQARILELVATFYSRGIFLTQGSNPSLLRLLHWQADSLLRRCLVSAVPMTCFLLNLEESHALQWLRPVHLRSGPHWSQCPQSPWWRPRARVLILQKTDSRCRNICRPSGIQTAAWGIFCTALGYAQAPVSESPGVLG